MTRSRQSASIDVAAYAEYLRTVEGRLRVDLAWENLRGFLPPGVHRRALDVGAGTGEMALRLALRGFQVTALDISDSMLAETERAAAEAGLQARVSVICSEADELPNRFSPSSFEVIVCHNLLEFVERPAEILKSVQQLLASHACALVSVIVRNRAGEVMSAAIKAGDLTTAETNLTAATLRAKLMDVPAAVFTPAELRTLLSEAGLEVIAEYGIRVFSDYLPQAQLVEAANYPRLLALEKQLGKRPEFAAIARYTQMIARQMSAGARPQEQSS